ncbi:GNAT family N-acetyltransferase [Thermoleophilia bacterium SCSIO 60948]|nr:GNAT family N-acetyltransferase [Thermoleophilia bacterium SCSIO 60948]
MRLSTDPELVDLDLVHAFLTNSYWRPGVSRETISRAIAGSIPFTLIDDRERQVGFARVVTDRATFAYLGDVFVIEAARGRGLGDWMTGRILDHPHLRGIARWSLYTADAHRLYERHGFRPPANPDWAMEIVDPQVGPG